MQRYNKPNDFWKFFENLNRNRRIFEASGRGNSIVAPCFGCASTWGYPKICVFDATLASDME